MAGRTWADELSATAPAGDFSVRVEPDWIVVVDERWSGEGHSWSGAPGAPGLWRVVEEDGAGGSARLFEIPAPGVGRGRTALPGRAPSGEWSRILAWAVATSDLRDADAVEWAPPSADLIDRLIPRDRLTVRVGSHLRQGRVSREGGRLALEFPLCRIPDDLPPARREWLDWLLRDAQRRWRMVRIGVVTHEQAHEQAGEQAGEKAGARAGAEDGAEDSAQDSAVAVATARAGGEAEARAVIDLTGAPFDTLERLCAVALDALRWVVEGIVSIAAFVAATSSTCRILEAAPPRAALACAHGP